MSVHYGGRGPGHIARVQGGGPTRSLDFSTSLPSGVTFSRGSSATYFDSAGVLQTASSNVARIDYNPTTLVSRGLLIEEARTNRVRHSNAFSSWTKSGAMSVTADQTGPDGVANSAYTVTFPAGSDWIWCALDGGASSTQYTISIWLSGSGTIAIGLYETVTGFSNYSVKTLSATPTRYTFTCTTAAATGDFRMWFGRIVGSGTATSVVCYGAQCEAGAFETSFIPTAVPNSATARSADSASMTGTDFSSWYNQSEGTFVVEARRGPMTTAHKILTASDNSSSEYLEANFTSTQRAGFKIGDGGVTQVDLVSSNNTAAVETTHKIAAAYKANNSNAALNGTALTADTTCTLPTVDRLFLGADVNGASAHLNGHIKSLRYYNTRLPDAQLQALTA